MKSVYKIDVEQNLIHKTHHGEITVDDEIKLLNSIFEDSDFRQGMDAICDFKDATVDWELVEMDRFRAYISRIRYVTGECKWALIFPRGAETSTARLFMAFNDAIGGSTISVKLFHSYEEGLAWIQGVKV